jgi:hypothetical protein
LRRLALFVFFFFLLAALEGVVSSSWRGKVPKASQLRTMHDEGEILHRQEEEMRSSTIAKRWQSMNNHRHMTRKE